MSNPKLPKTMKSFLIDSSQSMGLDINKFARELGKLGGKRTAENGTNSFANGLASAAVSKRWAAMTPEERSAVNKRSAAKRKNKP